MKLADDIHESVRNALDAIPHDERSDIYVVSLFVYDRDDDPRRPTVTVGFNTESMVTANLPVEGDFMRASSASEARWNYAFWPQNQLAIIGDDDTDPEGAQLREAWIREAGMWFDVDDPDAATFDARGEPITAAFVALLELVKRLHADGEIERIFGRPIPVIIHELEYYDQIADQNLAANPAGVIPEEFITFCREGF